MFHYIMSAHKHAGKFLFILALLISSATSLVACPTCGCLNPYLGIFPYDRYHSIGLWYRYHNQGGGEGGSLYNYNTLELRLNLYLTKRLSLYAVLPYTQVVHNTDSSKATLSGANDATLLLNYFVLWHESEKFAYRVALRGGVKLPIGPNYPGLNDEPEPEFALGAGRLAYVVGVLGMVRYKSWGANLSYSYTANRTNTYGYRVGDGLATSASIFKRTTISWKDNRITLMPSIGVYYEEGRHDAFQNEIAEDTGAKLFFATAGVDAYWKRVGLSVVAQVPTQAQLYDGLQQSTRVMVGFTYSLGAGKKSS